MIGTSYVPLCSHYCFSNNRVCILKNRETQKIRLEILNNCVYIIRRSCKKRNKYMVICIQQNYMLED